MERCLAGSWPHAGTAGSGRTARCSRQREPVGRGLATSCRESSPESLHPHTRPRGLGHGRIRLESLPQSQLGKSPGCWASRAAFPGRRALPLPPFLHSWKSTGCARPAALQPPGKGLAALGTRNCKR